MGLRFLFLLALALALLPWLLGVLAGLWQPRYYASFKRRGLRIVLAWPVALLGRGHRWLWDHCPPLLGCGYALGIFGLLCLGMKVVTSLPSLAPIATTTRAETGYAVLGDEGRVHWLLGDTEALIKNQGTAWLRCASTQQELDALGGIVLGPKAQYRLPADHFARGWLCRRQLDALVPGVRLAAAAVSPALGGFQSLPGLPVDCRGPGDKVLPHPH